VSGGVRKVLGAGWIIREKKGLARSSRGLGVRRSIQGELAKIGQRS